MRRRREPAPVELRQRMVDDDLLPRSITDAAVITAMRTVPRERFVSEGFGPDAYRDHPLPIECGQTISQPFIVALMAQAAELTVSSRVLEIGTGSAYGAAVLSRIASHVWTVERHAQLADQARVRLHDLGYDNVTVVHGDGTLGLADAAPFDAIVVTAAAAGVPEPLVDQLADGGRLVVPVGAPGEVQELTRLRRIGAEVNEETLGAVRFVPLITDG